MKCEQEKCTRTATIKNDEYHPNQWLCTFHANKAKIEGRIKRKLKPKTKMKKPMSAEEWFKSDKQNSHYWATDEDLQFAQDYSTYLLKHHLEQFAEECKGTREKYYLIAPEDIDQALTDYLTKNNIK